MIRELKPEDWDNCISIVDEVWNVSQAFQPIELAERFLQIYTLGSLAGSNYAVVAEEDNRVVGFLFGISAKGELYRTKYSGARGQLKVLFELLMIKKLKFSQKTGYLKMLNTHEMNRRKAEPDRSYEVNLFAVSPTQQGKGVGKELMRSFITKCKADGVTRVTLDTDEECNYKFYDHFGYRKISEFYSPLQEMYSQKSGISYVYELKLV